MPKFIGVPALFEEPACSLTTSCHRTNNQACLFLPAKVHYGTTLANVDWLHGGAEVLLTFTNLFIGGCGCCSEQPLLLELLELSLFRSGNGVQALSMLAPAQQPLPVLTTACTALLAHAVLGTRQAIRKIQAEQQQAAAAADAQPQRQAVPADE